MKLFNTSKKNKKEDLKIVLEFVKYLEYLENIAVTL